MARHIPNVLDPFGDPYASREERAQHADNLRALADWVQSTEFPIPRMALKATDVFGEGTINIPSAWIDDPAFVQRPGCAVRLLGGKVEKSIKPYGTDFILTKRFGDTVAVTFSITRGAVCTPREETVIESQEVPVDQTRDVELKERIEALEEERRALEMTEKPVPVTKTVFDCPPALLPEEKVENQVLDQQAEEDHETEDIPF